MAALPSLLSCARSLKQRLVVPKPVAKHLTVSIM